MQAMQGAELKITQGATLAARFGAPLSLQRKRSSTKLNR